MTTRPTTVADQAPGLHGHFAAGTATPFRVGQAPCGIS
jgi:hypothetical protein